VPNAGIQKDSPYVYDKKLKLSVTRHPNMGNADLHKLFRDKVYGKVEFLLLEALSRYHYLNKYNLARYIDSKLQEKKWADYSHVIKKLLSDNVIYRVDYGESVFYAIHEYARAYIEKKWKKNVSKYRIPLQETPEAVLECASLAQWHLSLTKVSNIKKNCFYQKIMFGKVTMEIPSYAELTIGRYDYRVISASFPKGDTNITDFFEWLKKLWEVLGNTTRKNQITLTVLSVTSLKQISVIEEMLNHMEGAQGRMVYYVLEVNTAVFSGLSSLYYYDYSADGENALQTISLKE